MIIDKITRNINKLPRTMKYMTLSPYHQYSYKYNKKNKQSFAVDTT